jgi:hypothetical protein
VTASRFTASIVDGIPAPAHSRRSRRFRHRRAQISFLVAPAQLARCLSHRSRDRQIYAGSLDDRVHNGVQSVPPHRNESRCPRVLCNELIEE